MQGRKAGLRTASAGAATGYTFTGLRTASHVDAGSRAVGAASGVDRRELGAAHGAVTGPRDEMADGPGGPYFDAVAAVFQIG